MIILLTAHIVDENHKSTVVSKAVKEINQVKPLRNSEALDEISEPTVDGPNVYGENIVWPKPVEETNTVANTNNNNKKVIRSSNMVVGYTEEKPENDIKTNNNIVEQKEEKSETELRANTDTEKYLLKKLKEISESRNNN